MNDDPAPSAECLADDVCALLYEWTGSAWLSEGGYYLLLTPLKVLVIIIGAVIARALLKHAINKIVDRAAAGRISGRLGAWRDSVGRNILENAGEGGNPARAIPERRRQRAEAIGSLLKSIVTMVVFSIAFLMILDLFGFNLAPVLTSLGVAGVALGFGAQTLVKDLIAGLFMLLEDQYGVGDVIDTGDVVGVVESVGLRVVAVRDFRGMLWYVRNGEIVRIGNRSQGWAQILLDIPVGFATIETATAALTKALAAFAADPAFAPDLLDPPRVLGVEQITVEGAVLRVSCKTGADKQWTVQRELRRHIADALESSGISAHIQASRTLRPPPAPES